MNTNRQNSLSIRIVTLLSAALMALGTGCAVYPDGQPDGTQSEVGSQGTYRIAQQVPSDLRFPASTSQPETEPETPEVGLCTDIDFPAANESDGCFRELVTRDNNRAPFNVSSEEPTLSRSGNLVAFTVLPTEEHGVNGLDADTNLYRDVYAVDLAAQDKPLELVSINDEGKVGNGDSFEASVSKDGRYVAFTSYASNLSPNESNGLSVIYVRDRQQRTTRKVSLGSQDSVAPNGDSWAPMISSNGRYVLFLSAASNLVKGDHNERVDLYLRDLQQGTTERISSRNDGDEADRDALPAAGISDDGRYVLFSHASALTKADADAANRPEAYRLDRRTGAIALLSRLADGAPAKGARAVALSPNGERALLHVGAVEALMGHDTPAGPGTVMVRIDDNGLAFDLVKLGGGVPTDMSADGAKVTFTSKQLGHVENVQKLADGVATANAYAHDRDLNENQLLTAADNGVPAVIHDSNEPAVRDLDWVTAGTNNAGDRFVVSTIQYGMTSDPALHCKRFRPRMIYVISCNPTDY